MANTEIQTHMDVEEIANVARHLWAVDCQLCNGPLGERPPSLVVYEIGPEVVQAMLAHTRCSPPGWYGEDGRIRRMSSAATLSWHAGGALIPAELMSTEEADAFEATQPPEALPGDMLPVLVVNPAMESVQARRVDGRWLVDVAPELQPFSGWRDLSEIPVGTNLLGGAVASIKGGEIHVGTERNRSLWWAGCADERFWSLLETGGGVLVVVTHSADPHDMGSKELVAMRSPGASIAGWVRLEPR